MNPFGMMYRDCCEKTGLPKERPLQERYDGENYTNFSLAILLCKSLKEKVHLK